MESVTVMVNEYVLAVVGVPEITPVDAANDKPVGSEPAVIVYVYGATPPLAVTVWLYAVPTVAAGKEDGDIGRAPLTTKA